MNKEMSNLFSWFDLGSFENGLLTEGIAMAVELVLIVNVLDWLRKRDENRKLARYRTRARKLLSRSLIEMDSLLAAARSALSKYRNQVQSLEQSTAPLPPPADTALVVSTIRRAHELLNRDHALYLPNLDDPTTDIFEAWLEQVEWMLAVWPIWRMTDPNFSQRWNTEDARDEQRNYVGKLDEIEGALIETSLVATSIRGSLLFAETQEGGDEELLREAKTLRDGTHVLMRARNWKRQDEHVSQ
jgi:hypothetical protein